MNQDETIGTTVFALDEGMDSGPILSLEEHHLSSQQTAGEVLDDLARWSASQLVEAVNRIGSGTAVFQAQDAGLNSRNVTFAPKLQREDGFIDFMATPSKTAARTRAVTPSPGAWTTLGGQPLKLGPVRAVHGVEGDLEPGELRVEKHRVLVGCTSGVVELGELAPAGRSWMDAAAWARGARIETDARLGKANG